MIRTAFDQGGELSAAVGLRRLFPGITDNAQTEGAGWDTTHYPIGKVDDWRGNVSRSVSCRCRFRALPQSRLAWLRFLPPLIELDVRNYRNRGRSVTLLGADRL